MFYTYVHCYPDGRPFYVGKGSGKRAWSSRGRNPWWQQIIKKHGLHVLFVAKDIDEELAFLCEQETIDAFHRSGIKLCNMTEGGEGASGFKHTEAAKQKVREAKLGVKRPNISGVNHHYAKNPALKIVQSQKLALRNTEHSGEKHPLYGKKRPDFSAILLGGKNPRARQVYVSELNMEFPTVGDAAKALGISYSTMKYRLKHNPKKYEAPK